MSGRKPSCECGECRVCKRRAYYTQWRERNQEKYDAYQREYRKTNAARLSEYDRERREANPELFRERKRSYFQRNRDRITEQRRTVHREARVAQALAWARRNPEKRRLIAQRYKARKRNAPLTSEAEEYLPIIANDPCAYCDVPTEAIDHIQPLSDGGDSDWQNLAGVCTSCNSGKKDRSMLTFLLARTA